jgi:uncharacterized repeat protein (TIGR01451 family)
MDSMLLARRTSFGTMLVAFAILALVLLARPLDARAAQPVTPPPSTGCTATSVIAPSTFQGCDGDLTSSGGQTDWDSFSSATINDDAASGGTDATVSVGGANGKEESPGQWLFAPGSPTPAKADFLRAASVVPSGLNDLLLYLGFTRSVANGDADLSIELNQLQPTCTSSATPNVAKGEFGTGLPCRSAGDLLIAYDGSGSSIDIQACRWAGDSSAGTWTCTDLDSTKAIASLNTAQLTTGPSFLGFSYPIEIGEFGEAVIDVQSAVGATATHPCFSYGSIWMHSRSSSSVTSDMQDVVLPTPLVTASCAVKVVKTQRVNGTGSFTSANVDAYVGDTINYRLTVTNPGSIALSNVVPADPKCDATPTLAAGGDANGDSKLDPTETWTYTCAHLVTAVDVVGGTYVNTVTTTAATGDTDKPSVSSTSTVTADLKHAGISITKTQSATPALAGTFTANAITVAAGATISYRVTVTNTGNTALSSDAVTDANCAPTGLPTTLAAGASATGTCSVTTSATSNQATYSNSASVTATDGVKNVSAGPAAVTADVVHSHLTLDKTQSIHQYDYSDGLTYAYAGTTLYYSIAVTNDGNHAVSNVTLADANCGAPSPASVASLAVGAVATFTCSHLTDATSNALTYDNTATATATDVLGSTVTSNADTVTATLYRDDLRIDKTERVGSGAYVDGPISVDAGETIDFRVTVTNRGNRTMTDLTLDDGLCEGISPASVASLAPDDTATFTCSHSIDAASNDLTYTNLARASATDFLGTRNFTGYDSVVANLSRNSLLLDKTERTGTDAFVDGPIYVTAGDTIDYQVTVRNTGNRPVTNVTLDDALCVGASPASVATLAVDATATFTCSKGTSATSDDLTYGNTAGAHATSATGTTVDSNTDSVVANLVRSSMLLDKTERTGTDAFVDGPIYVTAGDTIDYQVTVTNTGNRPVTNVLLDDTLCAHASPASAATLAVGATATFTCDEATSATSDDLSYGNTAGAHATSAAGTNVDSNADSVVANLVRSSLLLDKTERTGTDAFVDGPIYVTAGDTIDYAVAVKNTGNRAVTNVTLDDAACSGAAPASFATLAAGATATFTCSHATDATSDDLTYTNTAQANATDAAGANVASNSDAAVSNLVHDSLTLDKRQRLDAADPFVDTTLMAHAGDTIQYEVTVHNAGNRAVTDVTLDDANCPGSSPASVATLAVGDDAVFTCSTTTDATSNALTHGNTAQANAVDVVNSAVTSNADTVTVDLVRNVLTLDKTERLDAGDPFVDGPLATYAGDTVSYAVVVHNGGNRALTDVTVDDDHCEHLAPASVATLAAGDDATFQCSHVTDAKSNDLSYVNTATATASDSLDAPVTSNSDSATVTLVRDELTLDKTERLDASDPFVDGPLTAHAGDTVSYAVVVRNDGNSALTNVTITDAKCSGITPASVATLAAGASTTFECSHVTDPSSNDLTYVNAAQAHGSDPFAAVVDSNTDDVLVNVHHVALSVVKRQATSAAGPFGTGDIDVEAGATIHYELVATNVGNVDTTVTPADAGCSSLDATPVVVAPGADATFTCSYVSSAADAPLPATTAGTRTNVGSVSGVDGDGGSTGPIATNTVTANIHRLGLTTLKEQSTSAAGPFDTTDVTVHAGETVYYRTTVTNTGNTTTQVTPVDAGCTGLDATAKSVAPGASATFTCEHLTTVLEAQSGAGTYVNTASATGTDAFGGSTTSNDSAVTARVLFTLISMSKTVFDAETGTWASTNRAHVGDTIKYTITVANAGNNTLDFDLTDTSCTAGSHLGEAVTAGDTKTYTCEHVVLDADGNTYVNTASIDGTDEGEQQVTASASASTTILKPDLTVTKQVRVAGSGAAFAASTSAHVGDVLEYEVVVTNTGNTVLTLALTDASCGPLSGPASSTLAVGASATYTCSHTIGSLDATPYVNTVRAVGTDGLKLDTAKEAHADAAIVVPGLLVDKQVRNATRNGSFADAATGKVGDRLEFRHTVTNSGNVPLTITVADSRCDAISGPSGYDGVGDLLAAGQSVAYTCSHVIVAADGTSYVNVVTVSGTDPLGKVVTASDSAATTITSDPVAAGGAARPSASSRLVPPSGCQRALFRPMVLGSNIRLVRFYVDGRLRSTVRSARRGRWIGRVNAKGLRAGRHRLRAVVTFTAATHARPRSLNTRFGVCRPIVALPAFTG